MRNQVSRPRKIASINWKEGHPHPPPNGFAPLAALSPPGRERGIYIWFVIPSPRCGERDRVSNRVPSQAIFWFHGELYFNIEFIMVNNFLMQATITTSKDVGGIV